MKTNLLNGAHVANKLFSTIARHRLLFVMFVSLTVSAEVWGATFTKVTSAPADWSGEYIVVYESNNTAYVWTGVDAAKCNTTTTISNNSVTGDFVTVTIAPMTGGYSIKVNSGTNSGKYIYGTSGSNKLNFGTTVQLNTLSYETDWVKITSNTSVLTFNKNSSDMRFRYYKSSSYSSQQHIQLYKLSTGGGSTCTEPTVEWNTKPANGEVGGSMTTSVTTNYSNGLTYSSSNTSVATVTNAGVINYLATGTTTITATVTGDGTTICEGPVSVQQEITVTAPAGGGGSDDCDNPTWQLVTNVSDLAVGDEIVIAASTQNYALSTTQRSANRQAVAITKSNNAIIINENVQVITLATATNPQTNTFAFHVGTGFLYASSSSSNELKTAANPGKNGDWYLEITNTGVASITAQGTNTRDIMQFNPNNNNPAIFACYNSASQTPLAIYKKVCTKETTYSVTLHTDGGTINADNVTDYAEGEGATLPTDVTKTGYSFAGWYDNSTLTGTPVTIIGTNETGDKEFWAKWTAKTYTVTLNQKSGSNGTESISATYDATMPNITVPTRTGYTFGGYWTNEDGTGTQYYNQSGTAYNSKKWDQAKDTILYAKWTPYTYTIIFSGNGSDGGEMADQPFTYDVKQKLTTNAYTRTNYNFIGWNTNASGNGTSYTDGHEVINLSATKDGQITLYAQWEALPTYTVSWIVNGNTTATESVVVGNKITQYPSDPSAPLGCHEKVFVGWTDKPINTPTNETPDILYKKKSDVPEITETITLHAVWADEEGSGSVGLTSTVAVGDQVVIVNIDNGTTELTGFRSDKTITDNNNYGTYAAYNGTPSSSLVWTVEEGSTASTFAFKNGNYYLNLGVDDNNLSCSETKSENSSWAITESDERAVVANAAYTSRKIMWNQSSPRFACYNKSHGLNNTQYFYHIAFYRLNGGTTYSAYTTLCDECTPSESLVLAANASTADLDINGEAIITFSTTGGNSGEITYVANPETGVTWDNGTATFAKAGEYSITASQGKNGEYCPTTSNIVNVTITAIPHLYFVTEPANPIVFDPVECGGNTRGEDKKSVSVQAYNLSAAVTAQVTGPYKIARTSGATLNEYTTSLTLRNNIIDGKINGDDDVIYILSFPPAGSSEPTEGTLTFKTTNGNTLTVNLSTPTITCTPRTLTFNDRGIKTTQEYYAGTEVPEPATPTGVCTDPINYKFDGWSLTAVTNASTEYTKVEFPFIMPANNQTVLHAVYRYIAEVEQSNTFMSWDIDYDGIVSGQEYLITANKDQTLTEYAFSSSIASGKGSTKAVTIVGVDMDSDDDDDYYTIETTDDEIIWILEGNPDAGYTVKNKATNTYWNVSETILQSGNTNSEKFVFYHPEFENWKINIYNATANKYVAAYGTSPVQYNLYEDNTHNLYIYGKKPSYAYTSSPECYTCERTTIHVKNGTTIVKETSLDLTTLVTSANTSAFVFTCEDNYATLSGSTFTATQAGTYTINVTQEEDATYCATSATITIKVVATGETWGITWNVAGRTNTGLSPRTVYKGEPIGTLPTPTTPAGCEGKHFMGWTTTRSVNSDGTGITYIDHNTTPTENSTYYAVFAEPSGSGAGEQLFYESFDTNEGTGGKDDIWDGNGLATADIKFDNDGWTHEKGSGAYACIKLGTASATGSATTPALGIDGEATLNFEAAAWVNNKEAITINLEIVGDGTIEPASVTLTKGEFTNYTANITGGTVNTCVKFTAIQSTNNRFFLDEVRVYAKGDVPATYTDYTTSCGDFLITYYGFTGGYSTTCNGNPGEIAVPQGSDYIIPDCTPTTDPQGLGRTFAGTWNTKANGSGTSYAPGATIEYVNDNITLYAQWAWNTTGNTELPTDESGIADLANTDVVVHGGNALTLQAGTTTIKSLTLKGGIQEDKSYAMPVVKIPDNATLVRKDNKINLDLKINNQNFYPFAVPFEVANTAANINYINQTLKEYVNAHNGYGKFYDIKEYNGALRAENGANKDENWVHVGRSNNEKLLPGKGYIISAVPASGTDTVTIRITMTVDNKWLANGEQTSITSGSNTITRNQVAVTAHTGTAATNDPCNAGWNFVANPYLTNFAGASMKDNSDNDLDYIEGEIIVNNGHFEHDGTEIPYVTVPAADFGWYEQHRVSDVKLSPMWSFFVQIGSDGTMNFTTEGRQQAPAALRANAAAANPRIEANLAIIYGEQKADHTGLIIDDRYTSNYEIGADLEKMFGSAYNTTIYTISQSTRLAYNALPHNIAQQSIPLGFRAAEEGEYTISLTNYEDIVGVESIILHDLYTGLKTNLLHLDYTFDSEATQDDNRFVVYIVARDNTTTDISTIVEDTLDKQNRKVLINNHLYIIHEGKMYNGVGQIVK